MIAHLRGRVAHRDAATVVVDVAGVGYLVHVAGTDGIPARGEEVQLHTSLQVREDSMTLYGFPDRQGLALFELLLGSSGVGPKLAMAACATLRPEVLVTAIATGDLDTITLVPGVGKKVAQRLVLELKDKVGSLGGDGLGVAHGGAGTAATGAAAPTTTVGEVREALAALGYDATEVHATLAAIDTDGDTAEVLRRALKALAGPVGVGR